MIPLIRQEIVKKGWLSDDELPDIIALAQSAPGVLAVNMSIFAGYKMRGFKGSVAATLGSVIPSFIIILCNKEILLIRSYRFQYSIHYTKFLYFYQP